MLPSELDGDDLQRPNLHERVEQLQLAAQQQPAAAMFRSLMQAETYSQASLES